MTATQLANALVEKGTVTVSLTKPHDPDAFYRTRTGLFVCSDFRDRILAKATPTESAPPATLRRFVIDREGGANDAEIEAELGGSHTFSETDLCWIIAELIAKQPGGKSGDLDNSVEANLFYTPFVVVRMPWRPRARRWEVSTWRRRGHLRWLRGHSVFSRN